MRVTIVIISVFMHLTVFSQKLYEAQVLTKSVFTKGIEGPVVDDKGNLYVVNYESEGTIGVVDTNGVDDFFIELPKGSIGNGLRFAADYETLYVADYIKHQILAIEMNTKLISVYAKQDSNISQPNDIAIMDNGILFASDPDWETGTGRLWRISTDGKFELLESDMSTTNGIEVSPKGEFLYVNESLQKKVWKYDLDTNGNISNKRLLISFADHGLDGMRCDKNGNLHIARYGSGTVAVVSPEGKVIKEIELNGELPTNIAFGGKEGNMCYVTLQDKGWVEFYQSEFVGRSFKIKK